MDNTVIPVINIQFDTNLLIFIERVRIRESDNSKPNTDSQKEIVRQIAAMLQIHKKDYANNLLLLGMASFW